MFPQVNKLSRSCWTETMAGAAQQQLAATLGGQYLNPFAFNTKTAADISTGVKSHLLVQVELQQVLWHNNKH